MQQHVIDALKAARYRLIEGHDALRDVQRLRYRCYRAEGMIDDHPDKIMADAMDETANAVHVAIEMQGRMVAAMRLHVVSRTSPSSPTLTIFPELRGMTDMGLVILDPTRFVTDPEVRCRTVPLHFLMLRVPFLAAMFYDVDLAVATVRSEHAAFYRRYLGYDTAIPARSYPELKRPLQLLTADFALQRDKVLELTPVFGPIDDIPQAAVAFPDLDGIVSPSGRPGSAAA